MGEGGRGGEDVMLSIPSITSSVLKILIGLLLFENIACHLVR